MIARFLPTAEEARPSTGKIVLKTALITTAVLAVIPTVFRKTENGFEGYGILSKIKYEKKSREDGGYDMNFLYTVLDLERYGIKPSKSTEEAGFVEAEAVEAEVVEAEVVEA